MSVIACDTTELAEESRRLHGTSPVCTAALGRTLTAAVMMGAQLKDSRHNLTLSINGGGPAGTVMATATARRPGEPSSRCARTESWTSEAR